MAISDHALTVVITGAATQVHNVAGLVYVTGYALHVDESTSDVDSRFPAPLLRLSLRTRGDLTVDPATFPAVFAADVPIRTAAAMAGRQRFMARRAGSHISETAGSHAVAVSQPTAVADVVLTAARPAR